MMEQKFKRGNLVKILVGHIIYDHVEGGWIKKDISPQDVGRLAVIQYSYGEIYDGRNPDNFKQYQVIYQDTGNTVAWKHDHELELVAEGGEHLVTQALDRREEVNY